MVFNSAPLLRYRKSQSVEEGLFSAEKEKWKAAMQEMDLIYSNDVRDLVELPKDYKPLVASRYSNEKPMLMGQSTATRLGWLLKDFCNKVVVSTMKLSVPSSDLNLYVR